MRANRPIVGDQQHSVSTAELPEENRNVEVAAIHFQREWNRNGESQARCSFCPQLLERSRVFVPDNHPFTDSTVRLAFRGRMPEGLGL